MSKYELSKEFEYHPGIETWKKIWKTYPYNLVFALYGYNAPTTNINFNKIFEALSYLDGIYTDLIVLRFEKCLTIASICKILKFSSNAVVTEYINRAIKRLRSMLNISEYGKTVIERKEKNIYWLNISARAHRFLSWCMYYRSLDPEINNLKSLTIDDLERARNIGVKCVYEIVRAAEEFGIEIKYKDGRSLKDAHPKYYTKFGNGPVRPKYEYGGRKYD